MIIDSEPNELIQLRADVSESRDDFGAKIFDSQVQE